MDINWSEIISGILAIVLPMVAVSIISLLAAGARYLWSRAAFLLEQIRVTRPGVAEFLDEAARYGVRVAEQVKIALEKDTELLKQITDAGQTLREYAKQRAIIAANGYLELKGIDDLDIQLIADAIERAVFDEFNSGSAVVNYEYAED